MTYEEYRVDMTGPVSDDWIARKWRMWRAPLREIEDWVHALESQGYYPRNARPKLAEYRRQWARALYAAAQAARPR